MMRFLYIYIVVPISSIILFVLSFKNKKIKEGIKLRWPQGGVAHFKTIPNSENTVWFHCSSGEFEYALPVIRELKNKYPKYKVLVTYFSPTYKNIIEKSPDVDFSCALPWEFPSNIKQFLKYHKPKLLLIARTDLWPELLYQANKSGVKSILFSTTISPNKFKGIRKVFYKFILSQLTTIYFVSKEDKENTKILSLSVEQEVLGDSRYDQVLQRLSKKKLNPPSGFKNNIFTLGSTWPEDEEVILPFVKSHLDKFNFIIAPHEVSEEHIENLKKYFDTNNINYCLLRNLEIWEENQVLLIDKVGYLAEVYKWSRYAFIGGSFKDSIHSVMEPLATGCVCFCGPHYTNNREAIEFKEIKKHNYTAINIINSTKDLEGYFKTLVDNDRLEAVNNHIKEACLKKTGSSLIIANKINKLIQ